MKDTKDTNDIKDKRLPESLRSLAPPPHRMTGPEGCLAAVSSKKVTASATV